MTRRISIVPHTHWDREWYEPYQSFRLRLVDMLDELIPRLEGDPSYTRFLLDGQLAMVEDYLEIRPTAEERIRKLTGSGRVSVGPWYALMDEFLVSGETIVRNLQSGMQIAARFGGAMPVGYLPDMFGHVAQMPQILCQAGLEHAVVWRGVPEAVDRTAFWWAAPDGSTVRTEYLVCGYGNGAAIPDDAKALIQRVRAHEEEVADFLVDGILYMNGTDHQRPQPWLGRVVAEANAIQDDYELEITSLHDFLSGAPVEGLPRWDGELRSGARANLLMGVGSNRVDVKQSAARAERALERLAEPLSALFLRPEKWPRQLLEAAWREMFRNSAHDSVCACSLDEVVNAVNHRYAEARQIGEGLADRALAALAASIDREGYVVVNPSMRSRSGLVEMIAPGRDEIEGAQPVGRTRAPREPVTLNVPEVRSILGQIREQQIGAHSFVNAIEITEDEDGMAVVIRADSHPRTDVLVEEMKRELFTVTGARPDALVKLHFEQPPTQRFLARVDQVPGFGWTSWQAGPVQHPVTVDETGPGGPRMTNGLVSVAIDMRDGTFSVDGLAGFDRLVDSGDHGDTYNYSPPDVDLVVDQPQSVSTAVIERGPVRARVVVKRNYIWPAQIRDRARFGEKSVEVKTVLELQSGERLVRVHTRFDNPSRDHRLRATFPLPEPAASSHAECAFAVVERGLEAEGGPNERGLPTFPSRRFVSAGGLTVVHEGLLEYELIDIEDGAAHALALTLLRCTGMLSQIEMTYRPVPAGPFTPLEGPQLLGPIEARYGVWVGEADPYALVDDAFVPLRVVRVQGGGHRPSAGTALHVEGAEVSALRREAGALELRVFNPRAAGTTVMIEGRSGWLVDLRGRAVEPFDGQFSLGPWAIATVRLSGAD